MKSIAPILLLISSTFVSVRAQNGQFSQFFSSGTLVNPAFVGTHPYLSARINFNKSNLAADGSIHNLSQATVSYPLYHNTSRKFQIGGMALTFFRESKGIKGAFTSQKVLFTGAYVVRLSKLSKNSLVFGLQAGVTQNRLSLDTQWGSQYNPYIGFDNTLEGEYLSQGSSYHPVFNFGVVYSNIDNQNPLFRDRSLLIGLSANNLNTPQSRFAHIVASRSPIFFKLIATSKFILTPTTHVHPSLLMVSSVRSHQLNLGAYISHQFNSSSSHTEVALLGGLWYRLSDSFIILGGIKVNDFSVGLSYDLAPVSNFPNEIYGQISPSLEISIGYDFTFHNKTFRISNPIF